jgi:hypothetical protein
VQMSAGVAKLTLPAGVAGATGPTGPTGAAASVATDAIWDAAGDLAVGSGADTAARLAKGAAGTVPTYGASTLAPAFPPGYEFDYAETTSADISITATVEASADTIVTGGAVSFDGSTTVMVEAYFSTIRSPDDARDYIAILLFDGTSAIGTLGLLFQQVNTMVNRVTFIGRHKLTPSNASHTYSIRAIVSARTGHVYNGTGGAGSAMPGFIRITKV